MKTNKTKTQKKTANRAVKKQIEQSLTEKFLAAVKGLGHDAEVIADDISKASKAAAKKLAKKFTEVKAAVEEKIDEVTQAKDDQSTKLKPTRKSAKLMKKVKKSVDKVAKEAAVKSKPLATSVKVSTITAPNHTLESNEPLKNVSSKSKSMSKKVNDAPTTDKKPVVKAVANNPVKKVPAKAIPTKTSDSSSSETKK